LVISQLEDKIKNIINENNVIKNKFKIVKPISFFFKKTTINKTDNDYEIEINTLKEKNAKLENIIDKNYITLRKYEEKFINNKTNTNFNGFSSYLSSPNNNTSCAYKLIEKKKYMNMNSKK
jgi:hypothetical protein